MAATPADFHQAFRNIPRVEQRKLDLLNPSLINTLASEFLVTRRPLHILINDASIMATPLPRDSRGYERILSEELTGVKF
jgi:hypothetical protein